VFKAFLFILRLTGTYVYYVELMFSHALVELNSS